MNHQLTSFTDKTIPKHFDATSISDLDVADSNPDSNAQVAELGGKRPRDKDASIRSQNAWALD